MIYTLWGHSLFEIQLALYLSNIVDFCEIIKFLFIQLHALVYIVGLIIIIELYDCVIKIEGIWTFKLLDVIKSIVCILISFQWMVITFLI